jgi:hypothetical protein
MSLALGRGMADSLCQATAFASAPKLVNLVTPLVIRAPIWRYRHHVITHFILVITPLENVIT